MRLLRAVSFIPSVLLPSPLGEAVLSSRAASLRYPPSPLCSLLVAASLGFGLRRSPVCSVGIVGLMASLCRSVSFVAVAAVAGLVAQRGAAGLSFFARLFATGFGGSLIFLYLCTRFVTETSSRQGRTRASANLNDSVAQLVEQVTLNHWVVSSSLTGVTTSAHKSF